MEALMTILRNKHKSRPESDVLKFKAPKYMLEKYPLLFPKLKTCTSINTNSNDKALFISKAYSSRNRSSPTKEQYLTGSDIFTIKKPRPSHRKKPRKKQPIRGLTASGVRSLQPEKCEVQLQGIPAKIPRRKARTDMYSTQDLKQIYKKSEPSVLDGFMQPFKTEEIRGRNSPKKKQEATENSMLRLTSYVPYLTTRTHYESTGGFNHKRTKTLEEFESELLLTGKKSSASITPCLTKSKELLYRIPYTQRTKGIEISRITPSLSRMPFIHT